METVITYLFAGSLLLIFVAVYIRSQKMKDACARKAAAKGQLFSEGPKAQHPHIDANYCIGCSACTSVCPEGDVLAMLGGKAVIVNGYKCVGHSLCSEACPVGAITMVNSAARVGADMPFLTPEYETNVANLFIVGELGGLALIKNAVNQGRASIDTITKRLRVMPPTGFDPDVYEVLIVGAGPAGISASLRAIENNLRSLTRERDELGGTVAKYPRQKLVMTSPVEFPMYGKFKKTTLSKEDLLAFWNRVLERTDFNLHSGEGVDAISKDDDGNFTVCTGLAEYRSRSIVLALGRAGTPRKLGIPGEELPKVMYRLIEADHYINKRILVVGGGDSAIEAAMGLASQSGNHVTLSYRQSQFRRIKDRNANRIDQFIREKKVAVLFNSAPTEFTEQDVALRVNNVVTRLLNDYVWVFAGGVAANDFLKRIGVAFGNQDFTTEGSRESSDSALAS